MEIWKEVKCYSKYEVSNLGNVRKKLKPDVYLNQYDSRGFKVVSINSYKRNRVLGVHRLVAEAFIENPNMRNFVIHKDWDKSNNKVENLEWAYSSEVSLHLSKRIDGIKKSNQAKLSKQDIMDVYEMTKTHDKIDVAKKFRITLKTVDLIIRLKSKKDEQNITI